MSDRYFENLRRSDIGNCIPSGRQLPRTPPLTAVKKQLDFGDPDVDFDKPQQSTEVPALFHSTSFIKVFCFFVVVFFKNEIYLLLLTG